MPDARHSGGADVTLLVEVSDPRRDPEPPGWSEFRCRHGLYQPWDYELLRVEAWMSRNPPLLVLARYGGAVRAAMTVMVCGSVRVHRYARPRGGGRGILFAQVFQPWLGEAGFVLAAGVDASEGRLLLRELERGVRRHLGVGLAGVAYRNVPLDLVPLVAGRGRLVRDVTAPAAVLTNRWRTDEEWLASLSRNRRKNVRRIDRLVAADNTLVVRTDAARSDVDGAELAAMLREHRRRHGRQPFDPRSPVAGAYLDAVVRRTDVHTLTYHECDGRLVAFCLMLDHPITPFLQFWATLPRDDGGRPHLYFDSHARAVRQVIRDRRGGLAAGRGMFEQKQSLGFAARPMCVVVAPAPVVGR